MNQKSLSNLVQKGRSNQLKAIRGNHYYMTNRYRKETGIIMDFLLQPGPSTALRQGGSYEGRSKQFNRV